RVFATGGANFIKRAPRGDRSGDFHRDIAARLLLLAALQFVREEFSKLLSGQTRCLFDINRVRRETAKLIPGYDVLTCALYSLPASCRGQHAAGYIRETDSVTITNKSRSRQGQ